MTDEQGKTTGVLDQRTPGQVCYEAYAATRDWKAFDGAPLPVWADVAPEIAHGWEAGAAAVIATRALHERAARESVRPVNVSQRADVVESGATMIGYQGGRL